MNKFITIVILFICLCSCSLRLHKNENEIITEHFNIHYYDSNDYTELCDILENNYYDILDKLEIENLAITPIYIYPDKQSFHNAIHRRKAPSWVVGTARNNIISIVSPYNAADTHTYEDMLKVVIHEFVHIAVSTINTKTPRWLNEGIASYEAKQMSEKRISLVKKLVIQNKIPEFYEIETNFNNVLNPYQISYTLVEYIISQYNYDILLEILKDPSNFEHIINIDKNEFNIRWKMFVMKAYG